MVPACTAQSADLMVSRNRLGEETSPYLRLHADNPVHWYAWGPGALEAAKRTDKPIFLSIGYSSCHWCHVMNRESFSDAQIAAYLNEHFICIKVDREERPDVDKIYMNAVQAITGKGGWPLSVFLLPDGRPFTGGTYFPPRDYVAANGQVIMPGFPSVLRRVSQFYQERRGDVEKQAQTLLEYLGRTTQSPPVTGQTLSAETLPALVHALLAEFDPVHAGLGGGPGQAPKFPQPSAGLLLIAAARTFNDQTLLEPVAQQAQRMARGGIYDHVGGGFHRYSVDREWIVPHFEKMLYDQGQLLSLYSRLYRHQPRPLYRRVADETIAFLRREMLSPEGLFYSALDADSEHEEGKFYVWSQGELRQTLGSDADWVLAMTGADGAPNFEGRHILLLAQTPVQVAASLELSEAELLQRWQAAKARLLARRAERVRPLLDTKVITSWNGLAIVGIADAAETFESDDYRQLAVKAAEQLLTHLRGTDGGLYRHRIDGRSKGTGYASDYAATILGLLAVHRLQRQPAFLQAARELADRLLRDYWDPDNRGFFYSGQRQESLFAPLKESYDGAVPSSNALAALALIELAERSGVAIYRQRAWETLTTFQTQILRAPTASTVFLLAADRYFQGTPATAATPAPLSTDGEPVSTVEVVPATVVLSPGQPTAFDVRLRVADGWHINANPASPSHLVPTTVTVTSKGAVNVDHVTYPAGKPLTIGNLDDRLLVYDGTVVFSVQASLTPQATPDDTAIVLRLSYQACDDQRCLAPTQREIRVPIRVAKD